MLTTYVEAICLNYRPKKDNTYPLMLRLTKSGKRKYVSLGLSVEERFWDFKKNTPKRNCPDRDAILAVIERKSKQYREQITIPEQEIDIPIQFWKFSRSCWHIHLIRPYIIWT